MVRFLLVAGVLCCLPCLPGCGVIPTSPGPVYPQVTGEWSGTFESSWGVLPMRANLTGARYSATINGEFGIDGQRASGTISGSMQTSQPSTDATFWGTLTISYLAASGTMCRSESSFDATFGSVFERAVFISTDGFSRGNCPESPTQVHVTLRR